MVLAWSIVASPIGDLLLVADEASLLRLHVRNGRYVPAVQSDWREDSSHPVLEMARRELGAYFARELRAFSVPIAPQGTPFQQRVWQALTAIPYGATRTYTQQAQAIGQPSAVRAVGAANGRNPISVIVPCHRVLGADGTMTGYAGGLAAKRMLLEIEAG
ncbi:MAG TPA: methylated-DNA--[protein]-cysteine S-methyltransferase [Burkholderiaceae bacterium]|jgi:methylated-DNA-[protein]-cysteine S-methyltransferase|nr:methylated-DNA--[protein]-cysteine S-methyltransferase [Burkholderiaceae bacterium]